MNIEAISSAAQWQPGQQSAQGNQPSFSNTAQLLGISGSTLSTDLQSGTTLAKLAQQKGVSSSDLLASVEKDLQANAPQGAPTLTSTQIEQIATNVINGTPPTPPNGPASSGEQGGASGTGGPPALSLSNTAQLFGVSSSDLSTDVQSGTTLAELAQQKGVSSSDLLASVEKDLQADAPQSAPSLSSDQLGQIATNIINGTQPSSTSATASGNLNSLATATGVNPNILLQQLSSGQDLTQLLDSPSQTSYGSSIADSITGGVAVDEYA
jgi:uncharacterized protein YidB (DUF937 family)